jgi:gluconolactonase
MKKGLFFSIGVLCFYGFYSCQKSTQGSDQSQLQALSETSAKKSSEPPASLTDGSPVAISYTHDATNTFTEGPAVDKFGNVFFTDQNHDKIYRWVAITGNVSLFLDSTHSGRSNGMAFDKDGRLIACADMNGELWSIDKFGNHEVILNNYNGKLLNGPNDVWINPKDRGMYITDPMFPRGYWDASDPRKTGNAPGWPPKYSEQGAGVAGHVYYLAPGSHSLVRVTTNPNWHAETSLPNGVVGSPDGKKLYINKWAGGNNPGDVGYPGGVWVFDINKDGTLSNMQPFAVPLSGCDGMSTDEFGNVYLSAGGIKVYNPQGMLIKTISTPGGAANNVFGGLDQKTLFITGGGSARIFTQKMNVQGVEKFGGEHNGQIK